MNEHTTRRWGAVPPGSGLCSILAESVLLAVALLLAAGNIACSPASASSRWHGTSTSWASPVLPSGAQINVALGCTLSSGTAREGDAWHGTVAECVWSGSEKLIPPGSEVSGVVTAASPIGEDAPAMLQLAIKHIRADGEDLWVDASSEPVLAGPPVARTLCPSSAAPGESAPGEQVVLSDLTVVTFSVEHPVTLR